MAMTVFLLVIVLFLSFILAVLLRLQDRKPRLSPAIDAAPGVYGWLIGAEAAIHNDDPAGPHHAEIKWLRTLETDVLVYPSLLGSRVLFIAEPAMAAQAAALAMTELESRIACMLLGQGIITAETGTDTHRTMRRHLGAAYSASSIAALQPLFRRHAHVLVDALIKQCQDQEKDVDVVPYLNAVAFDILAEAALGQSTDCLAALGLEDDRKHPIAAAFDATNAAFARQRPIAQVLLTLVGFIAPILADSPLFARNRAIRTNRARMERLALDLIDERAQCSPSGIDQASPPETLDVVSRLLAASKVEPPLKRADKDMLVAQINAFLFAGHETVSATLSWLIHALATHQTWQANLYQAIQHIDDLEEAATHPLLEATIKETLRLFPPARVLRRVADRDVVLCSGRHVGQEAVYGDDGKEARRTIFVPKGQNIVIGLAAMNRSLAIWGLDADTFNPSRWLDLPTSHKAAHLPYDVASFGFGPKACLGARFALTELRYIVAGLVLHFHFEPGLGSAVSNDVYDGEDKGTNGAGVNAKQPSPSRGPETKRTSKPRIVPRQGLFFRPVVQGEEHKGPQLPIRLTLRRPAP